MTSDIFPEVRFEGDVIVVPAPPSDPDLRRHWKLRFFHYNYGIRRVRYDYKQQYPTMGTHPGNIEMSYPDAIIGPLFQRVRVDLEVQQGFRFTEQEWQYIKHKYYGDFLQTHVFYRNQRIKRQDDDSETSNED